MAKTTKMVEVPIAQLVPYERNAKHHPAEQLERTAAERTAAERAAAERANAHVWALSDREMEIIKELGGAE